MFRDSWFSRWPNFSTDLSVRVFSARVYETIRWLRNELRNSRSSRNTANRSEIRAALALDRLLWKLIPKVIRYRYRCDTAYETGTDASSLSRHYVDTDHRRARGLSNATRAAKTNDFLPGKLHARSKDPLLARTRPAKRTIDAHRTRGGVDRSRMPLASFNESLPLPLSSLSRARLNWSGRRTFYGSVAN